MTRDELVRIMGGLSLEYRDFEVTPERFELWFASLGEEDYEPVHAAAMKHIESSKWAPKLAEIRDILGQLRSCKPLQTSGEVLGEIMRAVGTIGRYREGDLALSPVAMLVVRSMGWAEICNSDNPAALRAHVMKMADAFIERDRTTAALSNNTRKLLEQVKPTKQIANSFSHVGDIALSIVKRSV